VGKVETDLLVLVLQAQVVAVMVVDMLVHQQVMVVTVG
jgi:hypothetical protein